MNASDPPIEAARDAFARPALMMLTTLVLVGGFSWLYLRAAAVDPAEHSAYAQHLRNLRELDMQADLQLLANRQERVRNYDALARHVADELATAERVAEPPRFLSVTDRQQVRNEALGLLAALRSKAERIENFKRHHSVLRNSLAYFPVAAENLLETAAAGALPPAARIALGDYVRHTLGFARAPDPAAQAGIAAARARLVAALPSPAQRAGVAHLLRHGDLIAAGLPVLERLTEEGLAQDSANALENLDRAYARGYLAAQVEAMRYRQGMYVLAVLLAALLALTLVRLERARRSLRRSHEELLARHAAQRAAEESLRLHATAFQNAHDGITLTDAAGNILDVNPAFTRITGFARDEAIGRNPRVLKSGRHDAGFYAAMWRSINETGSWRGEIWNRNKYGEIYPELLSISVVRDTQGAPTNYVAVFADISRFKAQEKQLARMAYYDALTDLPNRVLLSDRLTQGIQQTRRTQTLMAVCYLDLDGFKAINDNLGHEAGDRLLVEMAARLKAALRGGDTVARLGGDEFVLLLLGLASTDECAQAIERLLAAIVKPVLLDEHAIAVSASIGVALFPQDDSDADTLLRHADQAMYQAKQEGKNRYRIFDVALDQSNRTQRDRLAELRDALARGEFVLHYQPKVNLRLGSVVGLEALIRWNCPERGLVAPGEFLPLMENDDLILEVGEWAIATAMAQMERWQSSGLALPVSVNVAGRQLQAPGFGERLKRLLGAHPAVAGQLELEILETTAIEDIAQTSRILEECRELGVGFALDDFGTGFSSLTYLKRLPANTIKIDQSFVRDMLNDANNLAIVHGVIGLTDAFQRQAIAEGVETAEHGRMLIQLNCELAQGYGIARPMPAEEIPAWAARWRPAPSWQEISDLYWDDAHYPLLLAEVEHRNWVAQLVFSTRELRPVPHQRASDHRHCNFGRWYHGAAQTDARLAALPAFARIEAPHRRVHEIAAAIEEDWRAGRSKDARARIPELLMARDVVLAALYELQRTVATRRPA